MMWKIFLWYLDAIGSVSTSLNRHWCGNLLMNCYLYGQKSSQPLPLPPPYLYIVRIENFHSVLTPSLSNFYVFNFSSATIYLSWPIPIQKKSCPQVHWLQQESWSSIFTPHVSNVIGVIVLMSRVCVSVSLSQPDGRTPGLVFWHGCRGEWYLGQIGKSRS